MNKDGAKDYLQAESAKLKTDNLSLSKYFATLGHELSRAPGIIVNPKAGKLLEEIQWKDHAKASGYFRTDSVGVKLPFPSCWIEINTGNGVLRGSLLKQLRENMIIGIALKKEQDYGNQWKVFSCEFLITVGTIAKRIKDQAEKLFPGRPEVKQMLGLYATEAIIPLPLNPKSTVEEIQSTVAGMEPYFWSLYLVLCALKIPAYKLTPTQDNEYQIIYSPA